MKGSGKHQRLINDVVDEAGSYCVGCKPPAASAGYGRNHCWYCGAFPATHAWQTIVLGETRDCPMCPKHDATTRVSLRLREIGETATADMLDDAIGIDTRPEFVRWVRP